MSLVNRNTFEVNGAYSEYFIYGSVEVTIGRETRRVAAYMSLDNIITARGITGRYRTGMKAWPAHIRSYDNGSESIRFGFDSRSGKHRKVAIHFS